jgi:multidrug efflux pump subunit AcrB
VNTSVEDTPEVTPVVVTTTFTWPGACAGEVATIVVVLVTVTL